MHLLIASYSKDNYFLTLNNKMCHLKTLLKGTAN